VIVDTGQPATGNGWLTEISFYVSPLAPTGGSIKFLLVNNVSGDVAWVSGPIVVPGAGSYVVPISPPVAVDAGWELGYYAPTTGVIPYDCTANAWEQQGDNTGLPSVGDPIIVADSGSGTASPCNGGPPDGRTYSMGASIVLFTTLNAYATVSRAGGLSRGFVTFHAALTNETTGQGISGQTVSFSSAWGSCSSTTNSHGVAGCSVSVSLALVEDNPSFTATYSGNANYAASSVTRTIS
jgi:hypothetical protein